MTNKPCKAYAQTNCEAWFYKMPGRIEVYVRLLPNGPTMTCTIEKRQLAALFKEASKP